MKSIWIDQNEALHEIFLLGVFKFIFAERNSYTQRWKNIISNLVRQSKLNFQMVAWFDFELNHTNTLTLFSVRIVILHAYFIIKSSAKKLFKPNIILTQFSWDLIQKCIIKIPKIIILNLFVRFGQMIYPKYSNFLNLAGSL